MMQVIKVGSDIFGYELQGKKEAQTVIFSNSLGTSLSLWEGQAMSLRDHCRVLRYDTRGHGQSAKNKGPYSIEQLGTDVIALADTLGIDRFSFCGISMGGLIGQWLGIHAPDRIKKLILCNTAARLGTEDAWLERAALVRSRGMGPVVAGTPGRWFTPDYTSSHAVEVRARMDELMQTDPEGYASCCEAIAYSDFRTRLGEVKASTLVVAGTHDPVTTPADSDYIAQRIPGSIRIDLDASHLSNVEANDAFNEAITKFLAV
jgi:3-oxoadipate enol-lactonase